MPTGLISVKALYQCYVLVLLTFSAALVQICLTFGLLEIVEFSNQSIKLFFKSRSRCSRVELRPEPEDAERLGGHRPQVCSGQGQVLRRHSRSVSRYELTPRYCDVFLTDIFPKATFQEG